MKLSTGFSVAIFVAGNPRSEIPETTFLDNYIKENNLNEIICRCSINCYPDFFV